MDIAPGTPGTGTGLAEVAPVGEPEVAATVAAAEAVLGKRFGARITLADPVDLGGSERSVVLRVRVAESPFALARTLVLKRYVKPGVRGPGASYLREAVSYQLFTALSADDRMCPELFAHDGDSQLLVLEDLGRAPTLAGKLHGDDARAAERALLSWAHSLGRLHATTAGREADFDALLRRLSRDPASDPIAAEGPAAIAELPTLLATHLGVATPAEAVARAIDTRALLDTSRHRAFSPSDSCPDNNLLTGGGVRFLDFEGGCVRNILFDAAYLRVPFPSCWCAYGLPAGMTDAMLAAWRAEVRVMWPDLDDDAVLLPALFDAQLYWVWLTTWQFLCADRHADTSRRALVLSTRWRHLADQAARGGSGAGGAVAEHAGTVGKALRALSGSASDLPLYPAFR